MSRTAWSVGWRAFTCLIVTWAVVGCTAGSRLGGDWSAAVGREWRLTQLRGAAPLAGTQATLTLSADGRVAGSSGANRFFGTYRVDDTGELQFAALGRTRLYRRDPPGVMQQEQQIFDALEAVTHYRLEADRLTLISAEQPLLRFAAAEQEPTPTPGP